MFYVDEPGVGNIQNLWMGFLSLCHLQFELNWLQLTGSWTGFVKKKKKRISIHLTFFLTVNLNLNPNSSILFASSVQIQELNFKKQSLYCSNSRQSDVLDNKQRANFHLSDLISVSGGWNGSVCHPEAQQSYSGEVEKQHWALQVTHMHYQQSEGLVCASLVFFFLLASNSTEIYITQIESKMTLH